MRNSLRQIINPLPEWRFGLDAAVVFVLLDIALFGFRAAYGGVAFLVAGVVGVLLGMAVSYVGERLGLNTNLALLALVAIYFLFGGFVALGAHGLVAMLPGPSTLQALASVSVRGWKELLTTEPPVGNGLTLYALPYALGLVGGFAGLWALLKTKSSVLPLVPAIIVLALGILFGNELPVDAFVQGAIFGTIILGWWAWRHLDRRSIAGVHRQRILVGVLTLVVALLLAPVVGPRLPFAGVRRRVVLTQYVAPPLTASDLASPLASFRLFTPGAPRSLASVPLFSVRGIPSGSLMRIATMTSYNGLVWGFGNPSAASGTNAFLHFGSTIPETASGKQVNYQVTLLHPFQAWLPDIGDPTDFHFNGVDANALATDLLFDPTTDTAADAALSGAAQSLTYSATTIVPTTPTRAQLLAASAGQTPVTADIPTSMQTLAEHWTQHATGAWQRVMLLAQTLKSKGRFSNGTESPSLALPGETLGRLESFLAGGPLVGKQIVGDDEQFAATLGLLANAVGVPARVVLGANVPHSGVVTGRDVHAWVEVELAGLGWVTVPPSTFLPTIPPVEAKLINHPVQLPQTPVAPPLSNTLKQPPVGLPSTTAVPHEPPPATPNLLRDLHLPRIIVDLLLYGVAPILAIGMIVAAFGGSKAIVRRRRRHSKDPMRGVAGAWRTIVDTVIELRLLKGTEAMTRRQLAQLLSVSQVGEVAILADQWAFGPQPPTSDSVSEVWARVQAARRELARSVSRRRRLRGFFSLATFRRSRKGNA